MKTQLTEIENHYYRQGLFEIILEKLEDKGLNLNELKRSDISAVDEFHVRGAAVSKELAEKANLRDIKILDVGCGIGGPARMLADEYNCEVTGVDLSGEFIRTAVKLSELVGLKNKTNFVQADATDLPFENKIFDAVWTQHVQMNIADKLKFYSEIYRVLKNGDTFIFYDIFKKGDAPITYPVPWADEENISFLFPFHEFENTMSELNFKQIQITDETEAGISFFEKLMQRIKEHGPPKLGLNVLMGESTKIKLGNLLGALKKEKLVLKSGIYTK